MINPFAEQLVPGVCEFTKTHGMMIVKQGESKSFGNGWIIIAGPSIDVRIVRDRDQISFDVSKPDREDWHALSTILAFVGADSAGDSLKTFNEHFHSISQLMTTDLEQAGYLAFEKGRSEAYVQRLLSMVARRKGSGDDS